MLRALFACSTVTLLSGSSARSLQRVLSLLAFLLHTATCLASADEYVTINLSMAVINITYHDAAKDIVISEIDENGQYGSTSRLTNEYGYTVHIKTLQSDTPPFGCIIPPVAPSSERWIALVEKGSCKLQKLLNALKNASAVAIYSHDETLEADVPTRKHKAEDIAHIFLSSSFGERVGSLVDNGTRVFMHISVGRPAATFYSAINKTSMLFLSISFIVLMIISLAWLVFYYVQRSRYTYSKQRLSRRLMCAAKKAISKMPLRTVRSGDEEIDTGFDLCAVCIEGYRSCDVVRILPCKHVFHKSCIDPWLIEHRSCPICKIDILKAYGLKVCPSRESMMNVEPDVVSTSFGYSEFVSPDAGGIGRDFDSDGVEIVRFQLAHVEYHSSAAADDLDGPLTPPAAEPVADVGRSQPITSEARATIETTRRHSDDDISPDNVTADCGSCVAVNVDTVAAMPQRQKSDAASSMRPPSVHSAKSSEESESNEMQSLMMEEGRSTSC